MKFVTQFRCIKLPLLSKVQTCTRPLGLTTTAAKGELPRSTFFDINTTKPFVVLVGQAATVAIQGSPRALKLGAAADAFTVKAGLVRNAVSLGAPLPAPWGTVIPCLMGLIGSPSP